VLANYPERLRGRAKEGRSSAEAGATVVLAAATTRGRELTATVACDLGAGYAPDAVDLRVEGGKLVAVRSIYSNNILTDVTFSSPVQVASVRARSFPMPEAGAARVGQGRRCRRERRRVKEQVVEVKTTDSGEVSLTDASKIVSGGRGVAQDPAKGFALVATWRARSAPPWAPAAPRSMRASFPTSTRWARRARPSSPTSTSPPASAGPFSTWPAWAAAR
jgi:hypothetical protein